MRREEPPRSSSSVYSLFSDRVGLPPYIHSFPRVLMKSMGAVFLFNIVYYRPGNQIENNIIYEERGF